MPLSSIWHCWDSFYKYLLSKKPSGATICQFSSCTSVPSLSPYSIHPFHVIVPQPSRPSPLVKILFLRDLIYFYGLMVSRLVSIFCTSLCIACCVFLIVSKRSSSLGHPSPLLQETPNQIHHTSALHFFTWDPDHHPAPCPNQEPQQCLWHTPSLTLPISAYNILSVFLKKISQGCVHFLILYLPFVHLDHYLSSGWLPAV